MTGKTAQESCS